MEIPAIFKFKCRESLLQPGTFIQVMILTRSIVFALILSSQQSISLLLMTMNLVFFVFISRPIALAALWYSLQLVIVIPSSYQRIERCHIRNGYYLIFLRLAELRLLCATRPLWKSISRTQYWITTKKECNPASHLSECHNIVKEIL